MFVSTTEVVDVVITLSNFTTSHTTMLETCLGIVEGMRPEGGRTDRSLRFIGVDPRALRDPRERPLELRPDMDVEEEGPDVQLS